MLGMTISLTLTVWKTQNQIKTMIILKMKFTKEMIRENEKILIQKESNFGRNIWGRGRIHLQTASFIIHYRKPEDTIMSFCKGRSQKIQPKLTRNNIPLERQPNSTMSPWHMPAAPQRQHLCFNDQTSFPQHRHTDTCLWLAELWWGEREGQFRSRYCPHHTPHMDTLPSKRNSTIWRQPWNHHGLQSNWIFRLAHLFFILLTG